MGDKQTLIDFVTWTKANYPADHYALVFWGHGWNWHPGVMQDDTNADTLDYDETRLPSPPWALSMWWIRWQQHGLHRDHDPVA
jgi:hypothetical protein